MFVALVIQHAKLMRHIILLSVACPALPDVTTLSHKMDDFREKFIEQKVCVLNFIRLISEKILILIRTERDIITNVHRSSCNVSVVLVRF